VSGRPTDIPPPSSSKGDEAVEQEGGGGGPAVKVMWPPGVRLARVKDISWGRVKGVPLGRQRVEEAGPAWRVRVSSPPDPPPPPGSALMMAADSTTPHICKGSMIISVWRNKTGGRLRIVSDTLPSTYPKSWLIGVER
jgi:hypothetical protein